MAKYDDMSFGKAFAAARKEKGAGSTFTWKGKSYSTNRADDKPSKGKSGSTDIAAMAKEAIDRSGPTRPRARPGSEEKPTRPRSRPVGKAPTATSVSTPEVTAKKLPPSNAGMTLKGYTWEEYKEGNNLGRLRSGLPMGLSRTEFMGMAQKESATQGMAKGGMVKKAGYAKGGMVKANCGASMKPTQKGTSKK